MFIYRTLTLVTLTVLYFKCEVIERKSEGDLIYNSAFCSNCNCNSPTKTYLGIDGFQKCIGPNTGCNFNVIDFPDEIPLITKELIDIKSFQVTPYAQDLCSRSGYVPSEMRITVQSNIWHEAPESIVQSISINIQHKKANVTFHKIWSGLLLRIQFGCKLVADTRKKYYPQNGCVLIKYEGKSTYPLNLDSISTQSPKVITPSTTNTASFSVTKTHNPTGNGVPPKQHKKASDTGMISGIIAGLIVTILVVIVIIIFLKNKNRRREKKKKEEVCMSGENIYEQINNDDPKEEFNNSSYGNRISVDETAKNSKQHNYANASISNYCAVDNKNGNKTLPNGNVVRHYDEIWDVNNEKQNDNIKETNIVEMQTIDDTNTIQIESDI